MTITDLLALTLGTWGLAWLLVYGTGPAAMLARLRQRLGVRYTADTGQRYGETWIGELFNCPVCLSVWVAPVMIALLYVGLWYLVWWMAVVGVVEIIANMAVVGR